MNTMNLIPDQDALQLLHRVGCGEEEIARLSRLRRDYRMGEMDQSPLDLNRLQFVRWLVTTGRLTDHLIASEEEERQKTAPRVTGWRRLKSLLDHLGGGTATSEGDVWKQDAR
jgi:hypothetical protein